MGKKTLEYRIVKLIQEEGLQTVKRMVLMYEAVTAKPKVQVVEKPKVKRRRRTKLELQAEKAAKEVVHAATS
jgi:spore cortex formation protein SpoVR/YcgB (stage V sporulation)